MPEDQNDGETIRLKQLDVRMKELELEAKNKLDVRLKKLELQAQIKIAKEKQLEGLIGVAKVAVGTGIVGFAAALFPHWSSVAEQATARNKFELEIQLAEQKVNNEDAISSRNYLESLAEEARSDDLQKRIVLADFYKHMAPTEEERERWAQFQKFLTQKQEEITKQRVDTAKLERENLVKADKLESLFKAEVLKRYEQPSLSPLWGRASSRRTVNIRRLQKWLYSNGCRVDIDGFLGPKTLQCIIEVTGLDADFVNDALSHPDIAFVFGTMILRKIAITEENLKKYLSEPELLKLSKQGKNTIDYGPDRDDINNDDLFNENASESR